MHLQAGSILLLAILIPSCQCSKTAQRIIPHNADDNEETKLCLVLMAFSLEVFALFSGRVFHMTPWFFCCSFLVFSIWLSLETQEKQETQDGSPEKKGGVVVLV